MYDTQENNLDLDYLVEQYTPLVKSTAKQITFNNDEYEDAVQNGYIGLLEASKNYDPEKGNFGSFAKMWVRGAILKGLREDRTIRLPDSEYRRRKEADGKVKEEKESTEALIEKGEDIASDKNPVDEIVSEKQRDKIIQDEIQKLPPKEKLVVISILDDMAVKQIANHLNVTKTRVYQIYYKAVSRMKQRI